MEQPQISFDDGAAYEDFMGKWSQLAGDTFLRWLAPTHGMRWLDVGCGNGAFTETLIARCAPIEVRGIDPSNAQIDFARARLPDGVARFQVGDAMALPFADATFDAAVMALVIFFVPDPARGVAEMRRVVKPGGSVSAYSWDMFGGGFPFAAVSEEFASLGAPLLRPPSVEASRIEVMQQLWSDAGLAAIETTRIDVQRTFADFDAFWRIAQTGPRVAPRLATMAAGDVDVLTERLRARLVPDTDGRITYGAHANAITGRVSA